MAYELPCLCLYLTHACSHLWNKHKREICTSTKKGNSFSYAQAYFTPIPMIFLMLVLVLIAQVGTRLMSLRIWKKWYIITIHWIYSSWQSFSRLCCGCCFQRPHTQTTCTLLNLGMFSGMFLVLKKIFPPQLHDTRLRVPTKKFQKSHK